MCSSSGYVFFGNLGQFPDREVRQKLGTFPFTSYHLQNCVDLRCGNMDQRGSTKAGTVGKVIQKTEVFELLGFTLMKKYIYEGSDNEEINNKRPENQEDEEGGSNRKEIIAVVVLLILLVGAVFLYYPPSVIDNLLNVILRDCPEKFKLDEVRRSLSDCELKGQTSNEQMSSCTEQMGKLNNDLQKCSREKGECLRNLDEARTNTTVLDTKLNSANEKILRIEERNNELRSSLEKLRDEKAVLSKKLDETEYKLGACRNKNMDHEHSNAELLSEIEGLKRELAKC